MKHLPTCINVLQLVLYSVIKDVCTQGNVKDVIVKVSKLDCMVNGGDSCSNKYLQICYRKKGKCDNRLTVFCLEPIDHKIKKTDLKAENGSKLNYEFTDEMAVITDIIVGITPTPATDLHPMATSCEITRTWTTNGFRVNTSSADGIYKFEILIEVECSTSTCSGRNCENCGTTHNLPTEMVTTTSFIIGRTTNKSTTLSTLYSTTLLTTIVSNDRTTTNLKTTKPKSSLAGSTSLIVTTEESITPSSNNTFSNTSNFNSSENPSKRSLVITVIVASVASILVILIVVVLIFVCYRKNYRKSRTTPAEDDKNRLVNDNTEGEDRLSNTDVSNGGHNNTVNLHIENESCDKMAIVTTETDDIVNKIDEGNGSMSSKQNVKNDISSEIVNNELEDKKMRNIVTEAVEDTEQSNNGVDTVSSVHNDTDDPCTHQHKKNKKKKQKRSDAEEDTPSISEDLSNRKFTADESNEIPNESNNGYIPDDEHSDAGLSNENEKKDKIKSDEMSSPVDNKENNDQDTEPKSKSKSQNDDIKLGKSIQNDDSSIGVQKNGAMTNSEDVSRNDVPSSDNGAVPNQAQSNGHFHHQEISRKEIENITEVKVETIMNGKMSEMKRDITEHTHNNITCINQVKEEVSVLKQDMQEKLFQHKNEIQEQINRNKKDTEKAEGKRQRKMQKLKDQIQECNGRLKNFEDRINEYTQNQELLDKKVEASGGKPDAGRREIIETENEIQKLRDEMNRLSENLRQQISQQKGVSSVPDTPLFTKTTHVSKGPPHSNDLLRSRTASDDALYRKHSDSIAATDQHSELEKKRKKKKRKKTPSIRFPGDGTVHIQHEDNTIDIEQIGPMEVQQTNRGIRLTGGNVEIDIKSPRKKKSSPQKDQTT